MAPWAATRDDLGFKTRSLRWLERLARKSAGQTGWEDYGVPLTNREQRELALRAAMVPEIVAMEEHAQTVAGFAGVEVRIKNGKSRVVLRFTERVKRGDRQAIKAFTSNPSRVRFDYSAEHTLTEMSELAEEIAVAMTIDNRSVHRVYVDIERNTVVAAVDPDMRAASVVMDAPAVEAHRSGTNPLLTVEGQAEAQPMACFSRKACGEPLRGGLLAENLNRPHPSGAAGDRLRDFDPRGFAPCTTGFMVNIGGRRAVTTADHCGDIGDRFRIGNRRGSNNAGFRFTWRGGVRSSLGPGGVARRYDMGAIEVPAAQYSPYLFRTKRTKSVRLKSVWSRNSIIQNNTVCVHGIRVGRSCGPVVVATGRDEVTSSGRSTDIIVIRLHLPGDPSEWGCSLIDNPSATRIIAGNSGGPVTDAAGEIGVGTSTVCYELSIRESRPGTTTMLLGMTPLEPALDKLGATLRTG